MPEYLGVPYDSADPVKLMHHSFLYTEFLYMDLREAIRYEESAHIIRLWKLWLPLFLGCKCHNYATEAVNLLANLKADFPKNIAYLATHNRTVNRGGRAGCGKPIDQMVNIIICKWKMYMYAIPLVFICLGLLKIPSNQLELMPLLNMLKTFLYVLSF